MNKEIKEMVEKMSNFMGEDFGKELMTNIQSYENYLGEELKLSKVQSFIDEPYQGSTIESFIE